MCSTGECGKPAVHGISLLVLLAGAELLEETRHPATGSILSLNLNHLQDTRARVSVSASNTAAGLQGCL